MQNIGSFSVLVLVPSIADIPENFNKKKQIFKGIFAVPSLTAPLEKKLAIFPFPCYNKPDNEIERSHDRKGVSHVAQLQYPI